MPKVVISRVYILYWDIRIGEIKNENPQWNWNQLDFDDFISKVSYENIKKAVLAERVEIALSVL